MVSYQLISRLIYDFKLTKLQYIELIFLQIYLILFINTNIFDNILLIFIPNIKEKTDYNSRAAIDNRDIS